MLLLAALITTTITILIIRMTIGFLWRPLRPRRRVGSTSPAPFWHVLIRVAATVIARRIRARGTRPPFRA
ncbi:MAG: hypothetical protein JO069_07680 [Verrucomicrobia bacterium]|nr:hypothetical protein [Verrucomicrobiota bacterium]